MLLFPEAAMRNGSSTEKQVSNNRGSSLRYERTQQQIVKKRSSRLHPTVKPWAKYKRLNDRR